MKRLQKCMMIQNDNGMKNNALNQIYITSPEEDVCIVFFLYYRKKNSWINLLGSRLWKKEKTQDEKQPLLNDCNGNLYNGNVKSTCEDKKSSKTKTAAKDDTEKPSKPGVSLVKVLWKTFGMNYVMGMSCNFFNTCLRFLNPILLK